jgi:hypothetical protein
MRTKLMAGAIAAMALCAAAAVTERGQPPPDERPATSAVDLTPAALADFRLVVDKGYVLEAPVLEAELARGDGVEVVNVLGVPGGQVDLQPAVPWRSSYPEPERSMRKRAHAQSAAEPITASPIEQADSHSG